MRCLTGKPHMQHCNVVNPQATNEVIDSTSPIRNLSKISSVLQLLEDTCRLFSTIAVLDNSDGSTKACSRSPDEIFFAKLEVRGKDGGDLFCWQFREFEDNKGLFLSALGVVAGCPLRFQVLETTYSAVLKWNGFRKKDLMVKHGFNVQS